MAIHPILQYAFLGAMGLCVGSFGGCVAARLPRGQSLQGRSHCPACDHQLEVADLVPVVSWLACGGCCRHCGADIPASYTIIETLTATSWLTAWAILAPNSPESIAAFAAVAGLLWCLVLIAAIDIEHGIIPDSLNLAVGGLGVCYALITHHDLLIALRGAMAAMAMPFMLAITYRYFRRRHGLGGGDLKLLLAGGLWLSFGFWNPWWLTVAGWWAIAGMITSVILLLSGRRRGRQRGAMGPGLAAGLALLVLATAKVSLADCFAEVDALLGSA